MQEPILNNKKEKNTIAHQVGPAVTITSEIKHYQCEQLVEVTIRVAFEKKTRHNI